MGQGDDGLSGNTEEALEEQVTLEWLGAHQIVEWVSARPVVTVTEVPRKHVRSWVRNHQRWLLVALVVWQLIASYLAATGTLSQAFATSASQGAFSRGTVDDKVFDVKTLGQEVAVKIGAVIGFLPTNKQNPWRNAFWAVSGVFLLLVYYIARFIFDFLRV